MLQVTFPPPPPPPPPPPCPSDSRDTCISSDSGVQKMVNLSVLWSCKISTHLYCLPWLPPPPPPPPPLSTILHLQGLWCRHPAHSTTCVRTKHTRSLHIYLILFWGGKEGRVAPPKIGHLHVNEGLVRITTELVDDRIQDVLNPGMLDGVVGCKQSR